MGLGVGFWVYGVGGVKMVGTYFSISSLPPRGKPSPPYRAIPVIPFEVISRGMLIAWGQKGLAGGKNHTKQCARFDRSR